MEVCHQLINFARRDRIVVHDNIDKLGFRAQDHFDIIFRKQFVLIDSDSNLKLSLGFGREAAIGNSVIRMIESSKFYACLNLGNRVFRKNLRHVIFSKDNIWI